MNIRRSVRARSRCGGWMSERPAADAPGGEMMDDELRGMNERQLVSNSSFIPRSSSLLSGLCLDDHVVSAGVVTEVALVDAEEEDAVALGDELAAVADEDEVVVVVADDGDEAAGRVGAHQLLVVLHAGQPRG